MNTSKIIKAYIGAGTYSTTEPITQGDYGYILQIEGAELPATYRVDFSNNRHEGEALTVYGNENGAEVPEELIATGKDIFAFYYYIGENFGKTAYTWKIPNDTRAKYGDRTPTPTQQDSIDQLIVRSNEAVETAEQKASEADTSARSAKEDADRAEQARGDAQTAQRKAEEAQESAERAKDDAETSERNASESERKAKGYADTASEKADAITGLTAMATTLPDGSSATASYDAETGIMSFGIPKGKDGTNGDDGYSPSVTVTDITGGHRVAITDKTGTKNFDVMDGDDYILTEQDKEEIADMVEVPSDWLKAFPTDTASGAIASFTDGADDLPLKSLVVDIDLVQDTSGGDPSPENLCPISGWTEVQAHRTGVNIFDKDATWTSAGNYILNDNGVHVSDSNSSYFLEKINVKPSTSFYIYGGTSANGIQRLYYFDKDGSFLGRSLGIGAARVETVPSNCHYLGFQYQKSTLDLSKWSINYPSTDHDYHPYTGRSIPINWQTEAGTVYGGKLDVLTGILTVTHGIVDMGTLNPTMFTTAVGNLFRMPISGMSGDYTPSIPSAIYCSAYKTVSYTTRTVNTIYQYSTGVDVIDNNYDNASDFKDAVSGVQVVYPLATPIEVQLDAHAVNSLYGQNNIFADTGDTSLEYRADPDLYIQRKMPEIPVDDVQIDGTSIVEDGVANVPIADNNHLGVLKAYAGYGYKIVNGFLRTNGATAVALKNGNDPDFPLTTSIQHTATFYGLAKAAGDTTQSQSSNAVGQYTEDAKSKISEMLGVDDTRSVLALTLTEATHELDIDLGYESSKIYISINIPAVSASSGMTVEGFNADGGYALAYTIGAFLNTSLQKRFIEITNVTSGLSTIDHNRANEPSNLTRIICVRNDFSGKVKRVKLRPYTSTIDFPVGTEISVFAR